MKMDLHENIANFICSAKVKILEISEDEFRRKDYSGEYDNYDFQAHETTIFRQKGTNNYLSLQSDVGVYKTFFNGRIVGQNLRILDKYDTSIFDINLPKNHLLIYELATINIRLVVRYMLFAFDLKHSKIVRLYNLQRPLYCNEIPNLPYKQIRDKDEFLLHAFPDKRGFNYLDGNPRKFRLAYFDKEGKQQWTDITMKEVY